MRLFTLRGTKTIKLINNTFKNFAIANILWLYGGDKNQLIKLFMYRS